ncbi:MAG: helix-turn-helix domain-containing protein [Candidatus Puniceispirillaceae bacterium]
MTPFGKLMRYWRKEKNITLAEQAAYLEVSSAYLSALEHGKRGKPSFAMVDQICVFFDLIWDEAEAVSQAASLSHPKPVIDVSGQSEEAVAFANLVAQNIDRLSEDDCRLLSDKLRSCLSH